MGSVGRWSTQHSPCVSLVHAAASPNQVFTSVTTNELPSILPLTVDPRATVIARHVMAYRVVRDNTLYVTVVLLRGQLQQCLDPPQPKLSGEGKGYHEKSSCRIPDILVAFLPWMNRRDAAMVCLALSRDDALEARTAGPPESRLPLQM